jgi:hypothetical protein
MAWGMTDGRTGRGKANFYQVSHLVYHSFVICQADEFSDTTPTWLVSFFSSFSSGGFLVACYGEGMPISRKKRRADMVDIKKERTQEKLWFTGVGFVVGVILVLIISTWS